MLAVISLTAPNADTEGEIQLFEYEEIADLIKKEAAIAIGKDLDMHE